MGNKTMIFVPIFAVILAALLTLVGYLWKNRLRRPIVRKRVLQDDARFIFFEAIITNTNKSDDLFLDRISVARKGQIKLRYMPEAPGAPDGFGLLNESSFKLSEAGLNILIARDKSSSVNLSVWRTLSRYRADQKILLHFSSSRLNWRRKVKTSTVKITLIAAE